MAAVTRRQYKGAAASTTITATLTSVATTTTLTATTGWPSTAAVPFTVVIDPGTSSEEKCSATISGSTLTLTRGVDDTTAVSHASLATIYPVFSADEADEANNMAATMTTKGDLLVTTGSAFNRLPVGTNGYVLTADSTAANGVAWAVAATPAASSTYYEASQQTITNQYSYADLATVDYVTITTGTKALVVASSLMIHGTAAGFAIMSFAVSGATTLAASDDWAGWTRQSTADYFIGSYSTIFKVVEGLTAGSNTFTLKYKNVGNTSYYSNRRITVFPL